MTNDMLNTFLETIQQAGKARTSAYDSTATVKRIEDGVAWVHIPGGVDETPVKLTINARVGDTVQVRVSGGTAFLSGNATAPPTDDTKANAAEKVADTAYEAANTAVKDAERAKEAADSAQASADSAAASAAEAIYSAGEANEAANAALLQLSNVEDVIGTVNWITEHGTYVLTEDTTVQENKIYYTLQDNLYTIVTDPQNADIATYYELTIDEALANYVASHLALTDQGLYLLKDDTAYKMLLSATGAQIEDENGIPAVTYGASGTEFSPYKPFYIGNDDAYILFTPATSTADASITIGGSNIIIGSNQTLDALIKQISGLNESAEKTGEDLDKASEQLKQLGSFVKIDTNDPTEPVMTLGSDQSDISLQMTNDQMAFYAKGSKDPIAYFAVDGDTREGELHVTNVVVVKEVRFGRWGWYERPNGNLSVKWIGADQTTAGGE